MSIDGTWNCILHAPTGKQAVQIDLTSAGTQLTGKLSTPMGEAAVDDGKVHGDSASWKCSVTKPMSLTLGFDVKVNGDSLAGEVKLGMFGKCPLSGTRV